MRLRPEGATTWTIAVINGPNMSSLGARDKEMYGHIDSLASLDQLVTDFGAELCVKVECMASNHEGDILEFIHASAKKVDGYILNPAGLTTYGEATRHALVETRKPYVEVHFSNVVSFLAKVSGTRPLESRFTKSATGLVMGFRQYSYLGALLALVSALDDATFLGNRSAASA